LLAAIHELIRERLPAHVARAGIDAMPPVIVKAAGERERGQCTGLVFARSAIRGPAIVVKVSRCPSQDERIVREHRNLTRLHAACSPALRASVPEPLVLGTIDARPALAILAHPDAVRLKDRPVRSYLSPRRAPETLARASRWLVRFARDLGIERVTLDRETIDRRFASPVRRYLESFRPRRMERDLLERLVASSASLEGLQIPLTASHGDFCPANILCAGREWIVIDWEGSLEPRLPLGDIFHFLASLDFVGAARLTRGNRGRNFAVAFLAESPFRAAIDRCLREAVDALEIPQDCLDPLFLVHWVESALEKLRARRSIRSAWTPETGTTFSR